MTWQENLLNNILVIGILLIIFSIIYCRVKGVTMVELFKEIKEIISPTEVIE